MKLRRLTIISLLIIGSLTLDFAARAQDPPRASTNPDDNAAVEKLKFTTFVVNNKTHDYASTLDVNGSRYAAYDSGSVWHADAVPFKEGENRIVVDLAPSPTKDPKNQSAAVTLELADDTHPKNGHSAILLHAIASDNSFCVIDLTFQFVSGHAAKLHLKEDHWIDAAHKKLIYEKSSYGSAWGPYEQSELSWSPEGAPINVSSSRLSRQLGYLALVESTDFKPDGAPGAEVKNGDGERRTYSSSGTILTEVTYRGGVRDGSYKEYDEHGNLIVAGTFKGDEQDGMWVRYGPEGKGIARSVYSKGMLRSGSAIQSGPTTVPANP